LGKELGISDELLIEALAELSPEYIVTTYNAVNDVPAKIHNKEQGRGTIRKSKSGD